MQDLGTLGGTFSQGNAINDAGQVTGVSFTTGDAQTHGVLWQAGPTHAIQDLGTLGGDYSAGFGINSGGQVVGTSFNANDVFFYAFLWQSGAMQNLGTLGSSFVNSGANSISDGGAVVGYSGTANSVFEATLWENTNSGYTSYFFNNIVNDGTINSGWDITNANAISEDGRWVSAVATNSITGFSGTVVLEANAAPVTATPEPATILLLGTGLAGMGGVLRRRRLAAAANWPVPAR